MAELAFDILFHKMSTISLCPFSILVWYFFTRLGFNDEGWSLHTGDLQKHLWWLVFLHLRSLLKHLVFPPTVFLKTQNNIYQVVAVNQYNGEATLQVLFFLYINRTVCRNQYRCKICCFCSPKQCFVIKSEMRLFHQNFLKCNLKYWPEVVNRVCSGRGIISVLCTLEDKIYWYSGGF